MTNNTLLHTHTEQNKGTRVMDILAFNNFGHWHRQHVATGYRVKIRPEQAALTTDYGLIYENL